MLENPRNLGFEETMTWIEKTVTNNKWIAIAVHDLQASMTNNGYEVLPVIVLAICQPAHAFKVLGKDSERIVSSMMPCRVSVYKKSDGLSYVSRMNTSLLTSRFSGDIKEVMIETSREIEQMLKLLFEKKR